MVPAPGTDPTRPDDDADAPRETDGGGAGFDEAALYGVVRKAVEDAILGVIGTLLLLGVAAVVLWTGVAVAAQATGPIGTVFGAGAVLFGLYLAAATLGVVPPAREWF